VYRQAVQRIVESVKASDIMTKTVVAVGPMMSVQQAASLMADRGVSGVPVVDESNAVVGVLSERDFLFRMGSDKRKTFMDVVARCLEAKNCAAIAIRAKNVEDIMSSPAVVIEENTGLLEITALLKKKQINRVPVVDANKKMVGIVSREDIVHASIVPGL
jgi:CBS domain-containing protein